jgi:hypothetical protein
MILIENFGFFLFFIIFFFFLKKNKNNQNYDKRTIKIKNREIYKIFPSIAVQSGFQVDFIDVPIASLIVPSGHGVQYPKLHQKFSGHPIAQSSLLHSESSDGFT